MPSGQPAITTPVRPANNVARLQDIALYRHIPQAIVEGRAGTAQRLTPVLVTSNLTVAVSSKSLVGLADLSL